jgi:hypothetical protein
MLDEIFGEAPPLASVPAVGLSGPGGPALPFASQQAAEGPSPPAAGAHMAPAPPSQPAADAGGGSVAGRGLSLREKMLARQRAKQAQG